MHDPPEPHAVANRWAQLSPEIIRCIASFIDPAEVAGAVKLINKATAAVLRESREIRLGGVATVYRSDASTSDPNLSLSVDLAAQPWPRAAFLAHWSSPSAWRTLNLLQRHRLVNLAASSGDAESLETALAHCGCSLTKGALTSAAAAGCVAACETLWAQGCDGDLSEALTASASTGQLQALEWLLRHSLRAGRNRRRRRRAGRHRRWRRRSATPDYFGLGVTACRGGHAHILSEVERRAAASRRSYGLEQTRFYDCCGYAAAAGGHTELISRLARRLETRLVEWKLYRNAVDENDGRYVKVDITVAFRLREVVKAAAHGCSLAALRHYYHKWSRWVWYDEDAEQEGDSEEEEEYSRWGGREPSPVVGPEQRAREVLLPLVAAAAGSPTPDAFDKVDWLLAEMRRHAAAAAPPDGRAPDGRAADGRAADGRAADGRAGAARAAAAAVGAHGGAAAATVPSPIAALPVSAAAKQPNFLQRLQQLESRGFADFVGAASAAAAEGRAEALAYLLQRAPAVAQVGAARDLLLEAAGRGGHVAVLRVLCERGVAENPGELLADAPAPLSHPGFLRTAPLDWVPDVTYAAAWQLEQELGSDDAGMDEEFRGEGLAQLFQDAAVAGAGLPMLRALQEEGVPVDLAAVAAAGSEEALAWAAAVLREQEGGALEPLSAEELWHCICGDYPGPGDPNSINGNFAAAAWLQEHGLAPHLGLAFTMARLQQPQTLRLQPSPQPPRPSPRFQHLRWALSQQPGGWGALAVEDWRKVLACVEQLVKTGAAWPHQLTWLQQRWLQEAQARLAEAEAEVAAGRLGRSWEEAVSKARAEVQAARAGK